ncbi:MAG TPA: PDZ domain-containing protein [Terriglobales bacterium]|jgi:serine protease Do|nr:PDZ domain-containing protein [Terriglobales bacterium]
MRNAIFITLLIFPLASIAARAESVALDSKSEIFGISSEDAGGSSYLGVDTQDITSDRLGALKLKEERGVEVTMVDQDAPAGKAGLKEHDVILTVNGAEVESVEQLRRVIRETPPGRVVSLGLSRDGQALTIKVQLAERKNSYAYGYSYGPKGKDFHFEMPPMPPIPPIPDMGDIDIPVSIVVVHSSARSGLMVENLTPQLGDFFGTKNGQGVLVRSVEKGSRADKAGFRAGDVVVKINGEAIHDSSDFSHALRSRKDNTATIGVIRDKKEVNITITLPERKQSDLERESLMTPEIDAETSEELSQWESEMAQLQPEMEEAVSRAMEQVQPEIERRSRDMVRQNQEVRRQMRDIQREFRDHQREIEREFQNQSNDFF